MQSTTSPKPTEFWWPHPDALHDLTVEDVEGGFDLSAPDDSECGAWLGYWNQSPEHLELFTKEFMKSITTYLDTLDGKTQELTDGQQTDSEQAEDDGSGPQS